MKIEISDKKKENKKKLLREVIVKIQLKQKDEKDRITNGGIIRQQSSEFARNYKFKKKKLKRPFYREYIERTEIDVIEGQK